MVSYGFYVDSYKGSSEISGPKFIDDFGQGDEYGLDAGLTAVSNIFLNNLMHVNGWRSIGTARHYILSKNIPEAIKIFKSLLDEHKQKANPAIRQTLLWMHENGLPGIGQIVEALGMDGICVEEMDMLINQLSDFLDLKEELVNMPEPVYVYDVLVKGHLDSLIEVKSLNVAGIAAFKQIATFCEGNIKNESLTGEKKFSVIKSHLDELKKSLGHYRNIVKVFLNRNVLSQWAKLLAKSEDTDKNQAAKMLKDENFTNMLMQIMSKYLQLVNDVRQSFNEIIAYFQMRLEMEQGVGDVLEFNEAVEVGI